MFSINQLEIVNNDFVKNSLKDRERFREVHELIEEFISKNNIVLSDNMGMKILLQEELETVDFKYTLYSDNALNHAFELANTLAEKFPLTPEQDFTNSPIIIMRSSIPNMKFEISFAGRDLITINRIFTNKSDLFTLIRPNNVKKADRNLLIMPPMFHLIDLYRILSSPQFSDKWKEAIIHEDRLYKYLRANFSRQLAKTDAENKQVYNPLIYKILKYMVGKKDIILTGEIAAMFILKKPVSGILTIIAKNSKNTGKEIIQLLGADTTLENSNVHLFSDFRLQRLNIRVGRKTILYIYNSAEYDLVPVIKFEREKNQFIQIANPFVISRFLLIEIWVLRLVHSVGGINEELLNKRMNALLSITLDIGEATRDGSFTNYIFQSNNIDYVGVYITDIIAHKQKMSNEKKQAPYHPQRYFAENGSFRVLSQKK